MNSLKVSTVQTEESVNNDKVLAPKLVSEFKSILNIEKIKNFNSLCKTSKINLNNI